LFQAGKIGVFLDVIAITVGLDDFLDVFCAELVLVFTCLEFTAGIDKQHLVINFLLFENQNRSRNPRTVEQFFRQTNYRIQQIFVDQFLANFTFAGATEKHTVWHNYAHTASSRFQGFDHMRDKSVISFSLRRYTATKTAKLIVLGLVMAPLIEAERWVSGHDIKQHQVAIFIEQLRATNGIAPLAFM